MIIQSFLQRCDLINTTTTHTINILNLAESENKIQAATQALEETDH